MIVMDRVLLPLPEIRVLKTPKKINFWVECKFAPNFYTFFAFFYVEHAEDAEKL